MKNRIRSLRTERSWSQAELARRLSVSRQTVNAIENERYDPSLPLAFRISELFGQGLDQIFDPLGGMRPLRSGLRPPQDGVTLGSVRNAETGGELCGCSRQPSNGSPMLES